MRKIALLIFAFVCLNVQAQLTQYTVNDEVFSIGDTLTIGPGTGMNGSYVYIQIKKGLPAQAYELTKSANNFTVGPECINTKAVITRINVMMERGEGQFYFVAERGRFVKYYIFIRQAYLSGEIRPQK